MTDWRRVEQFRAKGRTWDEIATDGKVAFSAPPDVAEPGRALKTLYLQRRSQARRGRSRPQGRSSHASSPRSKAIVRRWTLTCGIALLAAALVWSLLASLVSALQVAVPVFPDLILLALFGAGLLGVGFVLWGTRSFARVWKKATALGLASGLALAGLSFVLVGSQVPILSPSGTSEPDGFTAYASNPIWKDHGLPTLFFYGSEACPYCSASSWAIYEALVQFGSVSGWQYQTSSPTDQAGPNTPEVGLCTATFSSSTFSAELNENCDNLAITLNPATPLQRDYLNEYDTLGTIPFVVVGGIYVHTSTFIEPSSFAGLSPQTVMSDYDSGHGAVYETIYDQQVCLEGAMEKCDYLSGVAPPEAVVNNPDVQQFENSLT